MTETERDRPNLKQFDAYTDQNGGDVGGESLLDVGMPARTQADLKRDPDGDAQTARVASGMKGENATDATAAETPAENLRRIGDPSPSPRAKPGLDVDPAASEAIERATAAVGSDDGE